jgi:YfiH family protein
MPAPTRWLIPHWPDAPANVGALSTLRSGGVSCAPYDDGSAAIGVAAGGLNLGVHVGDDALCVEQNRALLQAALPGRPAWLSQVHGTCVVDAASVDVSEPEPVADASFSSAKGVVCAILSADCLPVLLCDAQGLVVAAAHAGWRGLAAGVLSRTVEAMRANGAGEILAWLGPAIGPRQFEVGADVFKAFMDGTVDDAGAREVAAAFVAQEDRPGKYLADIYALARCALMRDGVQNIAGGQCCTVSEPLRFYSYRRDGITGRQASLIWRK